MILDDICEFIVDCPHSTAEDEGAGYPLIRTPNIGRGQLILDGVHRVSKKVYEERTKRGQPQKGDLILAREAPAGNVALLRTDEKVCLGQRTVLIRPNTNYVNPVWLTYYLLSPKQQWRLLGDANGATVAHVNLPVIRNLDVTVPPLEKQNCIAEFIVNYDNFVENNNKQIALLEEAAQRLYVEWFVKFHFPGHENVQVVDGVPEGWEKTPAADIFSLIRGKSYTSAELCQDSDTLLINLKNIRAWGGYKRGEEKNYCGDINKEQTVTTGDIVMAVTDMTAERRLVGHFALIPKLDRTSIISMDLVKVVSKGMNNYFLYSLLRYSGIERLFSAYANGTNVLHLNPELILNEKLLVPERFLINKYASIVTPIYQKIDILNDTIKLLQEARDRLLPKLMNGEIEV